MTIFVVKFFDGNLKKKLYKMGQGFLDIQCKVGCFLVLIKEARKKFL